MSRSKPTVIALVGPTASGKTALSIGTAEELNGEIIACDSRTVYRYFDIGTAKPSPAEQQRVPHHLIDVADPEENYTAAQFAEQGSQAIRDITARGALPIVCGGTGFYSRTLLEGLSMPSVLPNQQLRDELSRFADEHGNEKLFARLQNADPETAARLNINDRFRVIRALEVHAATGKPMSQVATKIDPPFRVIWIGLNAEDRSVLHQSIRTRMQQQLAEGLLDETRRLYERYGKNQKLLHTVNYKQYVKYLDGEIDERAAFDQAVHHNQQLARKQLIWFRANAQIKWFNIDTTTRADLRRTVISHIKESLRTN